ncbi:nucleotidyltransferase family protein [Geoalkalibacter sp.]|uniref:nucleotidyltransferase family protein n=1 Tax=Geoalkalibacter sp. TaxID=3041440 RepID=UPI00272EAFC4|nr:nucleotidyltransferase family protein [Geoalkalibacter sp.]
MAADNEIFFKLHNHLHELRQQFGVGKIGIFGSYARNEQRPESDIDLLVEFVHPVGFVQFMRLEAHLQDLLGKKVDLVTRKALKPRMGKRILAEVRYVQ